MYSSRGSNGYGQDQPYSSHSSYVPQSVGAAALLGGGGGGGVHGRPSAAAGMAPPSQHYGGEYSSIYGSAIQQQQKQQGSETTAFEGRSNYGSSMPESPPKFTANDYVPSSIRGYGQNVDQLYSDRTSEYPSVERRQYVDRAYLGRDLPSEPTNRYAESVAYGHEQSKLYSRLEQTTILRQEEMRNARVLQSASVEGGARQADYLVARAGVRHPAQDPIAYGGRLDPELRNLSMLTGSSYSGNSTASILGAAPHRNLDDLIYAQSSTVPGYGVSLPPGRDYGVGKGLHRTTLESDYPTSILGRVGHLVDDRKDDRATYSREFERRDKERDYLRERLKDREREKDQQREREREREREHERDRERQRERDREREREKVRERERERREKNKEREHKRKLELKREPTPPRVSRDRRASSMAKDIRSLRRESPRHSPIKERRREYSCKVFSFSFVEAERDYLSLDKRYSRLYVSPECSKVVLYWPRKNLRLSLHTPISFEHDFVEAASAERKESLSTQPAMDISGAVGQTTVWNAKVILMSGVGQNDLADLSSERTYNDRIPHFGNLLRFAILKKGSTLMGIGGPWNTVDGGDPSVDDSSLVRTAMRYAKDIANLDLKNCQHWNRFLEIHYDRVGKDGLFSHKEVTVLYVPDLSECLPSLESWNEQLFNHKKSVSERERLRILSKEVPGDKKEGPKDKRKVEYPKDSKTKTEVKRKKEGLSSGQSGEDIKNENDDRKLKGKEVSEEGTDKNAGKPKEESISVSEEEGEKDKAAENKDVVKNTEDEKIVLEGVQEENPDAQPAVPAKTVKKKIIKRIVKRKVAKKKETMENAATEQKIETVKEGSEGSNIVEEVGQQLDGTLNNPPAMKTFVKKGVVQEPANAAAAEKDESSVLEVKADMAAADKEKVKSEDSNAVVVQECSTKTTVKKKIIKRVPKKKSPSVDKVAEDELNEEKIIHSEDIKGAQNKEAVEMNGVKKEETDTGKEELSGSAMETGNAGPKVSQSDNHAKSKETEDLKDKREGEDHDESESKSKTNKTANEKKISNESQAAKEKKRSDEPPKHPGFILQTKGSKVSKLQSLSFSLDSLLDYSDKDIEESTFELSVFAESFYEMLQYEMGCRLLVFLQILRVKFVANRIKEKRQREETSQKENEESSSKKRAKTGNTDEDLKSTKSEHNPDNTRYDIISTKIEDHNNTQQDDTKTIKEETTSVEPVEMSKIDDEIEEDPEEDPEEDEEMLESSPHQATANEGNIDAEKNAGDSVGLYIAPTEQNEKQEDVKHIPETIISSPDPSNRDKSHEVESKSKEAPRVVNKELLEAFRFFDRNRVGYIRVEDLRLILHNLGKFLSNRDVKELVQSALLESNTGRDDRILYEKLVKTVDLQK